MKKLAIISIASLIAFSAQAAETKVLNRANTSVALEFTDEFTGNISACQINLGKTHRTTPRISILDMGSKLMIVGSAGGFDASGFQFKIDSGEHRKFGTDYKGGDSYYGFVEETLLNEISSGSTITIRAFPENQFAESMTKKYSLTGSSKTIYAFNQCRKKLNK
ncbi:exported hypothetical protein [Vibrio chagasii]|nr:exported hypothetical protein [Vibrio chagasii]